MSLRPIIIHNACILTGCGPVVSDGYIHVEDRIIASVGDAAKMPQIDGAAVIDAGGCYVLPGFINTHMHFYSALARGMKMQQMKSFGQVLKDLWWRLDQALDLDCVRVSAMLGAIDSIKAGVTTVFDHHASYGAVSGSLSAIDEALAGIGLRASLCFEISDRNGRGMREDAMTESAGWLEKVQGYRRGKGQGLRGGMVGLHASMTLSDDTLDAARELMDAFGAAAHIHVAEGTEDVSITRQRFGSSPVRRLAKKGILRPGSIAAHCVYVDNSDMRALAEARSCVVHNPLSNLNNAVGIAPFLEMERSGIGLAIGTDGMAAGIGGDAFLASVLHRPAAGDAQAGFGQVVDSLWKTAPAFASNHFGQDLGAIRKGASADIIIIDAHPPTPASRENAGAHLMFGALSARVRTTIVAGRVCMEDFVVKGVDEKAVAHEARILAQKLWKKMG